MPAKPTPHHMRESTENTYQPLVMQYYLN